MQPEVLSRGDQEYYLLYACVVAGKSAKFADAVMGRLCLFKQGDETPFEMVRRLGDRLESVLREVRTGNYGKLARCFRDLAADEKLDLLTCTPDDLEAFHGIGPKTSRFFIMWIRPEERHAALDVHVLRWLRAQGHDAPESTPSAGPIYDALQAIFLQEAEKRGVSPRQLDFAIWKAGSGYEGTIQDESTTPILG